MRNAKSYTSSSLLDGKCYTAVPKEEIRFNVGRLLMLLLLLLLLLMECVYRSVLVEPKYKSWRLRNKLYVLTIQVEQLPERKLHGLGKCASSPPHFSSFFFCSIKETTEKERLIDIITGSSSSSFFLPLPACASVCVCEWEKGDFFFFNLSTHLLMTR